jgi:hypothetical protein
MYSPPESQFAAAQQNQQQQPAVAINDPPLGDSGAYLSLAQENAIQQLAPPSNPPMSVFAYGGSSVRTVDAPF